MDNESRLYWERVWNSCTRFVWNTCAELYEGIRNEKIDVVRYLYPGTLVAVFFVLRADHLVAWVLDSPWLAVSFGMRKVIVYVSLFAGWLIWSGERALYRGKLLSRLRAAFLYCGLRAAKRLPAFIEDRAVDDHVRKLKLLANGIPLKAFKDNKENLEAQLNISIVKMTEEDADKSRINILYAMKSLPSFAKLESIEGFGDGEIPIGLSYEGPIIVSLRDVVHVLVAGQTGGGKSNFEKVAASILTVNNPEAGVVFLDFKGGMEIADLLSRLSENHQNFDKYEGPTASIRFLAQLGATMEDRLKEIARVGAASLDEYLKKRVGQPVPQEDSAPSNKDDHPRRMYLFIDEIGQLYARDPSIAKEDLLNARAAVNRIARQGRAAGIHLIVATQKPDALSFDQTVKANLPAVLCFPMVSQAASISALGTKRAYDLNPEIKGRAVWKYGPHLEEVQTYLFQ